MIKASKDSIIALPNPHLRHRSKKIGVINEDVQALIDNMVNATLDWEDSRKHEVGVALAAIQIDVKLRVIIIRNDFNDKTNRSFSVFINPEITKLEGKVVQDYEGCLSIKDVYGKVPRHERVRVKALTPAGKTIKIKAEGFLARIFQHEIDHTNGKVFLDHIKGNKNAFYRLNDQGELEDLDYDKRIKDNHDLWY